MTEKRTSSSCILSGCIFAVILIIFFPVFTVTESFPADQPHDSPSANHVQQGAKTDYDSKFRTGPHKNLACDECHTMENSNKPLAGVYAAPDSIQLCRRCHPEVNTHPVGIEIRPASSGKQVHSLPLGTKEMEGKIVCLTCHAVHLSADGQYLLRGKQAAYRSQRTSLCLNCHQDRFQGKSPHFESEEACGFCHIARPSKEKRQHRPPDILMQASCDLCHNELTDSHYTGTDPFLDANIHEEAVQSGIVPDNGQPACTSCHTHHDKTNGKYRLTAAYIKLSSKSRAIDPHWNNYHCLSCHVREPVKSDAPLQENGDINALCNRCHSSEYARSDIHPVGIKPSQLIRVPAGMPLQDGILTCATCHDSFMQVGGVEHHNKAEINIFFLRGNVKSRTPFCFLCHLEETYKRLNPHEQLDDQGEVREETCLFCHATIPDIHYLGPEKVSFIVQDPDAYCIGCHHGFAKNHPAGINHMTVPSDKIMAALNTSIQRIGVELPLYKGRIVCATCHNPHQTGVIKFSSAATGTKRENKLRLMPGRMQCIGCHWDKR